MCITHFLQSGGGYEAYNQMADDEPDRVNLFHGVAKYQRIRISAIALSNAAPEHLILLDDIIRVE